MKYPKIITKINNFTGLVAGGLVVIIAFLQVFEAIMRGVFSKPTSWSLDISIYLLVWVIFLGSSFSFQEKGHVAVDFVLNAIGEKSKKGLSRKLNILGYIFTLTFLVLFIKFTADMIFKAIKYNQLTLANVQIPVVYLYLGMSIGTAFMIATVVSIIMDLVGGGEKYM